MIMIGTNAVLTHTHVLSIPFISASTQTHVHTLTQWTGDPIHCLLGNYNWFKITLLTTALAYTHTLTITLTLTQTNTNTHAHTLCAYFLARQYTWVYVCMYLSLFEFVCAKPWKISRILIQSRVLSRMENENDKLKVFFYDNGDEDDDYDDNVGKNQRSTWEAWRMRHEW